jgi:hypothetical protein
MDHTTMLLGYSWKTNCNLSLPQPLGFTFKHFLRFEEFAQIKGFAEKIHRNRNTYS